MSFLMKTEDGLVNIAGGGGGGESFPFPDEPAEVGNQLYVAEIDEDGKPTKWTYSEPEPPDPLAPIMDKDISELTYDEIAMIVRAGRAEENSMLETRL